MPSVANLFLFVRGECEEASVRDCDLFPLLDHLLGVHLHPAVLDVLDAVMDDVSRVVIAGVRHEGESGIHRSPHIIKAHAVGGQQGGHGIDLGFGVARSPKTSPVKEESDNNLLFSLNLRLMGLFPVLGMILVEHKMFPKSRIGFFVEQKPERCDAVILRRRIFVIRNVWQPNNKISH